MSCALSATVREKHVATYTQTIASRSRIKTEATALSPNARVGTPNYPLVISVDLAESNNEYPCSMYTYFDTYTEEVLTTPTFTLSDGYARAKTSLWLRNDTFTDNISYLTCAKPTYNGWDESCTTRCRECTLGNGWNFIKGHSDAFEPHVRLFTGLYNDLKASADSNSSSM